MNTEQRDFDKEAATWDENPARVKAAKDIAKAIVRQVAITPDMDAMDFGCGTGLLTLQLQPLVRTITGVDSSQGMLDIFEAKIANLQLANASSQRCDLEKGDTLAGRFNLIASSMTLHHVKKIKPLLAQFYRIMSPGGFLCLADLDLDEGQFHQDNTGVFHGGFDRAGLGKMIANAGFANVAAMTATKIEKQTNNGKLRSFSVFLMTAQKR